MEINLASQLCADDMENVQRSCLLLADVSDVGQHASYMHILPRHIIQVTALRVPFCSRARPFLSRQNFTPEQ